MRKRGFPVAEPKGGDKKPVSKTETKRS